MKNYLFGLIAITAGIGLSAFTKPVRPFTGHNFKFKSSADARFQSQVQDRTNWEEATITCDGANELPCSIFVDDIFSHPVTIGGVTKEVLNTPTDNPQSEGILIINTGNGYLDTTQNPHVQYYVVTLGLGFVRNNKSF